MTCCSNGSSEAGYTGDMSRSYIIKSSARQELQPGNHPAPEILIEPNKRAVIFFSSELKINTQERRDREVFSYNPLLFKDPKGPQVPIDMHYHYCSTGKEIQVPWD